MAKKEKSAADLARESAMERMTRPSGGDFRRYDTLYEVQSLNGVTLEMEPKRNIALTMAKNEVLNGCKVFELNTRTQIKKCIHYEAPRRLRQAA